MKISIHEDGVNDGEFFLVIENAAGEKVWIDDEAHSSLGEVEARARADALRAVTGWEVVCEYE